MHSDIQDFFVKRASKRLKNFIERYELSFTDIYPGGETFVSWAVKGKRSKRNPFLFNSRTVEMINEIMFYETGNENNIKYIYWGDSDEIEQYIDELIYLIMDHLDGNDKEVLNDYLLENVYYAETKAYLDSLENTIQDTLITKVNNKTYESIKENDLIPATNEAKKQILYDIRLDFCDKLDEFLNGTIEKDTRVNYKHTNAKQPITFKNQFNSNDIINVFMDVVKLNMTPKDESIGLRVYNILKQDISKLRSQLNMRVLHFALENSDRYPLTKASIAYTDELFNATNEYVEGIKKAQRIQNEIIENY